jgi:hypothetical protein
MNRNGFLRLMLGMLALTLVVAINGSTANACLRGKLRGGDCCCKSKCDTCDKDCTPPATTEPAPEADCSCKKSSDDCDTSCCKKRCRSFKLFHRNKGGCCCEGGDKDDDSSSSASA